MQLIVENQKQALRYTALVTIIAVAVPVLVVGAVMMSIPHMPPQVILLGVTIAFFIPLLIAPPLAYICTSIMRKLHETITKVDDHVKFDPLTGVLNRSHFLDRVRAHGDGGVLMMLDADHFKRVNDERGHAAGDQALRVMAHTVSSVVGSDGLIGRLGGEEFSVFLPGMSFERGHAKAEEIGGAMRELEMIVEQRPLTLTVSIGCVFHSPQRTIGQSLKQADELLYVAKANGRDCVMPSPQPVSIEDNRIRA